VTYEKFLESARSGERIEFADGTKGNFTRFEPLKDFFVNELKDVCDAEHQILLLQ